MKSHPFMHARLHMPAPPGRLIRFISNGSPANTARPGESFGFGVKEDGYIIDVINGSPADKAGLAPAMTLLAVNSRKWTSKILRAAVKFAATNSARIELLIENTDYYKTCKVDYHGGERYPILERDPTKPDLLSEILKPLTPEPGS